jgi:DNA replication protein DnaC
VRCDCRLNDRTHSLLKAAKIPRRYDHCELANFETAFTGADPSLKPAKLLATRFVEEFPVDETGVLFTGNIGVGKTHLSVGIIKELILKKGIRCKFVDYRELLKEIQHSYNPQVNSTEMDVLRPIFDVPVLVLDELGAQKPTDWVWDTISLILNNRYNARKTTIITANYHNRPPLGVEYEGRDNLSAAKRVMREETLGDRIGERMRSRLNEMCRKAEMTGIDFRRIKAVD